MAASVSASTTPIKIYYWPMLARQGALVRMLEHTSTPYEYISDKERMAAEACSAWGADTSTFAPPVVVIGDNAPVSQSVAVSEREVAGWFVATVDPPLPDPQATMALGKHLGLTPEGHDEYKSLQLCLGASGFVHPVPFHALREAFSPGAIHARWRFGLTHHSLTSWLSCLTRCFSPTTH